MFCCLCLARSGAFLLQYLRDDIAQVLHDRMDLAHGYSLFLVARLLAVRPEVVFENADLAADHGVIVYKKFDEIIHCFMLVLLI